MGKNQDPGSGINIPDPQHWWDSVWLPAMQHLFQLIKENLSTVVTLAYTDPEVNLAVDVDARNTHRGSPAAEVWQHVETSGIF
jgi:hypothetical protein